ncbi:lysophospholipid acyltransferase family protein [Ectothiorhodospiraceae bacterium 2226]|nr:lysophospholipid acyltransferase family protein [Ectothiorhodospiraceae bacterium 2226]
MNDTLTRAALRATGLLPLSLLQGLGAAAGWLGALLPNGHRRISDINLRLCFPGMGRRARRRLMRRSLQETVKVALECPWVWRAGRETLLGKVRAVEGRERLDAALAEGKGVILASPHLGNWEVVGLWLSHHYPITSMFRPQRSKALDTLMLTARERFGAKLVPSDASGVRRQLEALRRGEIVGLLPDQNPGKGTGVFAPFFGIQTNTPVLPGRLAAKTGAPLLFVFAERLPWGRGWRLRFQRAPAEVGARDAAVGAAALNAGLEACIRALPEQYWWSYKRFRRRPEGEPRLY